MCLPNLNELYHGFSWRGCYATGWGKDDFGKEGRYQVVLKKVRLDLRNHTSCQESLRTTRLGVNFELDESAICAGGLGGVDTCRGDGGGPLVCPTGETFNNQYGERSLLYAQVGIVGWGIGCGKKGIPGVYTDVTKMLCFIDWASRCRGSGGGADFGLNGPLCGRSWARKERRKVRLEMESYRVKAAEYDEGSKSRGKLEREARKHEAVLRSWDEAIDKCQVSGELSIEGEPGGYPVKIYDEFDVIEKVEEEGSEDLDNKEQGEKDSQGEYDDDDKVDEKENVQDEGEEEDVGEKSEEGNSGYVDERINKDEGE